MTRPGSPAAAGRGLAYEASARGCDGIASMLDVHAWR